MPLFILRANSFELFRVIFLVFPVKLFQAPVLQTETLQILVLWLGKKTSRITLCFQILPYFVPHKVQLLVDLRQTCIDLRSKLPESITSMLGQLQLLIRKLRCLGKKAFKVIFVHIEHLLLNARLLVLWLWLCHFYPVWPVSSFSLKNLKLSGRAKY